MENATKALVMAGSVLIAIIIIALLYSFMATLTANAEQEDLRLLAQQTEKFNREYEAFEQKLLRGTDVVTVINKAMANNKKYDNYDKIYDVDVQFVLATPVKQIEIDVENGEAKPARETEIFAEVKSYSLIDNKQPDRINAELKKFVAYGVQDESKDSYVIRNKKDENNYTKVYESFTVFKRKFFTCTKLEYNDETGRVNLLVFEERVLGEGQLEGYY